MIHCCHPFQLGSNDLPMPMDARGSFEIDAEARLVSGDHIVHGDHEWLVVFVQFHATAGTPADVRVKYNGRAHRLRPYVEEPFRQAQHA